MRPSVRCLHRVCWRLISFLWVSTGKVYRTSTQIDCAQVPACLYSGFYEAPHRILETVTDMVHIFGVERGVTFARELTKVFETIHTCALGDAIAWLQADTNRLRGEFVLLLTAIEPPLQTEFLNPQVEQTLAVLQKIYL